MLSIEQSTIEKNSKLINFNLNYPNIKEEESDKKIIKYINKRIHEDIIIFKDVVSEQVIDNIFEFKVDTMNALTEYRVTFNQNYIISIPIEFSQLVDFTDITYINCYNYDIVLKKQLLINDIFNKDINDIQKIKEKISNKVNSILNDQYKDLEIDENLKPSLNPIYSDQYFYIEHDGIVICFGSYELSEYISYPVEIKIHYYEYEEYLSKYTINNIWKFSKDS